MLLAGAPQDVVRNDTGQRAAQYPFRPSVALKLIARQRQAKSDQAEVEERIAGLHRTGRGDTIVSLAPDDEVGVNERPDPGERVDAIELKVAPLDMPPSLERGGQVQRRGDRFGALY